LCDVDPDSTADIERWAVTNGLAHRVATVTADGMRAVARRVLGGAAAPATAFVHIDPYDPRVVNAGGMSAVTLARRLIVEGVGATDRCATLGRALSDGYAGVPLPSGAAGGLDFDVVSG
jgi:hypothetical protein